MAIYKDYLGLNYCIYEPTLTDPGAEGGNTLGYDLNGPLIYSDLNDINQNISPLTNHFWTKTTLLLNLHRNGPYGYPTWKQVRVSDNHLSRAQRKRNIFTYVQEPGPLLGNTQARFGEIETFTEPVVVDSYKPLSLVGDISDYNDAQSQFQNRSVEIKTSFGNETAFFANKKVNEYFDTIHETDDNYEELKELYLDGGLEDDGSPLETFNLLVYKQTVFPKQQYAYLNETRTRKYYDLKNDKFWRDDRENRNSYVPLGSFGATIPQASIWPLDADLSFGTIDSIPDNPGNGEWYDFPIGVPRGHEGGPGILQNNYNSFISVDGATVYPGLLTELEDTNTNEIVSKAHGKPAISGLNNLAIDDLIYPSIEYSRLHTLKSIYSLRSPSGIELDDNEIYKTRIDPDNTYQFEYDGWSMPTSSLFQGRAAWDAANLSGKKPFYDSYSEFSADTRIKGKGYAKIPEFRISNHVDFYLTNGPTEELGSIFEVQGGGPFGGDITTSGPFEFYEVFSTTDFLKHFELVKRDHKDFAGEKILTLKCKAIKKLLPYKGFYPADRTVEIAKQFYESYKEEFRLNSTAFGDDIENFDRIASKSIMTPLFSPGILFNTIKSGVAVDFPIILGEDIRSDIESFSIPQEGVLPNIEYYSLPSVRFLNDYEKEYEQGSGGFLIHDTINALFGQTKKMEGNEYWDSIFSTRIPFEALVNPEAYIANKEMILQEPHPFGLSDYNLKSSWSGVGDPLYRKMISNFLAEVPEFFLHNQNLKTIASLEEQNPEFGNVVEGNYYVMRVKMTKSRDRANYSVRGIDSFPTVPPQDFGSVSDVASDKNLASVKETITMYSRPTAFGPPTIGDAGFRNVAALTQDGVEVEAKLRLGSMWGHNFPYTPPYYHGDAWCDLIYYAEQTGKKTLTEILQKVRRFPYYSRYWDPSAHDALRDLSGYLDSSSGITTKNGNNQEPNGIFKRYGSSDWARLIKSSDVFGTNGELISLSGHSYNFFRDDDTIERPGVAQQDGDYEWSAPISPTRINYYGPQSPEFVNYNAMQLNSSVNLFGRGTIREMNLEGDGTEERIEVASDLTTRGKTRWIIQPKFETPILNFNKYKSLEDEGCTPHDFAPLTVPRGMWHQYGELPKADEGVFLQVTDIPDDWLRAALGIRKNRKDIKSLADLVGFSKDPVRLGEVADVKEISEAVVAVPFIEKDGTRQFFSIPRGDIDSCIDATRREVGPGTFVAGGPPKAGDSVYQMVKKMKKYVFPPSMDFVRYKEIDPFAMYIFEFKHNLSKQDLADIWQNLSPEIGTRMEEAEATISHELLAHELLGGGAVVKNGTLDDNAEGNGIPSNIQWMVFKAKKRAKTNYFDKVVAKKGTTAESSSKQLENANGRIGDNEEISYNWPYDFFSLVELVKLDAEVTFANIENDDKGQKTIKKVEKKSEVEQKKAKEKSRNINVARGKIRFKK